MIVRQDEIGPVAHDLSLRMEVIEELILEIRSAVVLGELRVMFTSHILATTQSLDRGALEWLLVVSLLGLPPRCDLEVFLVAEGMSQRVANISIDRQPLLIPDFPKSPQPLMVTSVGRSGSTLLMQYLSSHSEIVVYQKYPFEGTIARKGFSEVVSDLRAIPYASEEGRPQGKAWKTKMESTVSAQAHKAIVEVGHQYRVLHQKQGGGDPLQYYAEKNLAPEWLVWEICPNAREIFLVRDPRDMICSSLAFNQKRGRLAFGRQDVETDLEYVAHRAAMARPWVVEPWLARHEKSLLVRYEDLIVNVQEVLQEIFQYLGAKATSDRLAAIIHAVQGQTDVAKKHSTTESPLHSIGRWRREMPPEMVSACNKEFGDFLSTFKYPLE